MIALCGDCGFGELQDGACQWCAGPVHIPGNLAVQQDRARAIDRAHLAALDEDAARDAIAVELVAPLPFRRRTA